MSTFELDIQALAWNYRKKEIFSNVSFSLKNGECIGIIGVNGSGKTTLFNTIIGELKHKRGTISLTVNGNTCTKLSKHIGYIPQENPLLEDLSAYDNLRLWYCNSSLDLDKELESGILNTLGINEFKDVLVKKLSGGMKKRLSIGIALASSPNILLLDEPNAALDLVAKKTIKDYLVSFKKASNGIIIATHDESDLDICDYVYVLKNGTLTKIDKNCRGDELISYIS